MAQLQAVSAALGLALTELLVGKPAAFLARGWEQIGFWRLERSVIARQLPQGIFCWAGLGKRRKKGLLWEKHQAKSSVVSCVFTHSQLLGHRTKGCRETDPLLHPAGQRSTHGSCFQVPHLLFLYPRPHQASRKVNGYWSSPSGKQLGPGSHCRLSKPALLCVPRG